MSVLSGSSIVSSSTRLYPSSERTFYMNVLLKFIYFKNLPYNTYPSIGLELLIQILLIYSVFNLNTSTPDLKSLFLLAIIDYSS